MRCAQTLSSATHMEDGSTSLTCHKDRWNKGSCGQTGISEISGWCSPHCIINSRSISHRTQLAWDIPGGRNARGLFILTLKTAVLMTCYSLNSCATISLSLSWFKVVRVLVQANYPGVPFECPSLLVLNKFMMASSLLLLGPPVST